MALMRTIDSKTSSVAERQRKVKAHRDAMHTLVSDLHVLLSTDRQTMLGPWIADARRMGHGDANMTALLEFNARNQVTMWGPDGGLQDYAAKLWAGLLLDYYWPRWEFYFKYLQCSIATGKPFDQNAYDKERRVHEKRWQTQPNTYTTMPVGEPVFISRYIYLKHYYYQ
ncbi:hypothetical protein SARC_00711 [Sphaeroforma arctica JP610]|uniref:Alpha-N-acetylglucosaminidase C-terminal domain-containing protein n=1 Tax=Sphaeroforma arctica JP610 TaxID=667725 RepID=A0A0L0GFX6_9EUKA|nr:hypothetical protein SARC_00711 [Sphaeroforma arctica JP610]KNC87183.1 hypothetical protein SARC_00711 [Sphaeroforma arctica JP610]|eukprot:XP_014161085.1 hypothetical protein SARC_00711 [Sphaeroforma arctica JP610]